MLNTPEVVLKFWPRIGRNGFTSVSAFHNVVVTAGLAVKVNCSGLPATTVTLLTPFGIWVGTRYDEPSYWRPGVVALVLKAACGRNRSRPSIPGIRESVPLEETSVPCYTIRSTM